MGKRMPHCLEVRGSFEQELEVYVRVTNNQLI